ncbi:MAG: hypothetical protein J6P73_03000, partial [Bacteroidales bacterium]|nr:hypothetical protein [Bacteroidales bacterium]
GFAPFFGTVSSVLNGLAPFFEPFSGFLESFFERSLAFKLGGYAPFYTTGKVNVTVVFNNETFCLSQKRMAVKAESCNCPQPSKKF